MRDIVYPGGLEELEFLDAYHQSTLRKPQIAADLALRAHVFAEARERLMIIGLIAEQLAESCRRLVAVHDALADRSYTVARSLMGPLPGVERWREFIQAAATLPPAQMVRRLGLDDSAVECAEGLRAQGDLSLLSDLVAAASAANPMLVIPWLQGRRRPHEFWLAGAGAGDGAPISATVGVEEQDAALLADLTAEMSAIARGFFGAYLAARRGAGRRD